MDIDLNYLSGSEAKLVVGELIDAYADIYNTPPYVGDPFFSIDAFGERLYAAFEMPGFGVLTARVDSRLVGYVHGVTLAADRPWWVSLGTARPSTAQVAAVRGDMFWLRELMVRSEVSNKGIGRRLHDSMISKRRESWAILTCVVGNEPAHGAYLRWGYKILGEVKHAPESPVYDVMIRDPLVAVP